MPSRWQRSRRGRYRDAAGREWHREVPQVPGGWRTVPDFHPLPGGKRRVPPITSAASKGRLWTFAVLVLAPVSDHGHELPCRDRGRLAEPNPLPSLRARSGPALHEESTRRGRSRGTGSWLGFASNRSSGQTRPSLVTIPLYPPGLEASAMSPHPGATPERSRGTAAAQAFAGWCGPR